MQLQTVSEAVAGHDHPAGVEEQVGAGRLRTYREPVPEHRSCLRPQWEYAFAAPLSADADEVETGLLEIVACNAHQLRHSQSSRIGKVEHRAVAYPRTRRRIRCVKHGLYFIVVEVVDQWLIAALKRNRVDLGCQVKTCRRPMLKESEE